MVAKNGAQVQNPMESATRGAKTDVHHGWSRTSLTFLFGGQLEKVQWLLANRAGITEFENDGHTALLLSSPAGQLETVQWLLAEGRADTGFQ